MKCGRCGLEKFDRRCSDGINMSASGIHEAWEFGMNQPDWTKPEAIYHGIDIVRGIWPIFIGWRCGACDRFEKDKILHPFGKKPKRCAVCKKYRGKPQRLPDGRFVCWECVRKIDLKQKCCICKEEYHIKDMIVCYSDRPSRKKIYEDDYTARNCRRCARETEQAEAGEETFDDM